MKRDNVRQFCRVAILVVVPGAVCASGQFVPRAEARLLTAQSASDQSSSVQAASAQRRADACAATVYVNDPDPKGTNIRSAPTSKSNIVSTITDSDSELDITGSSGDWLRVRQIRSADGTATYKGEGWVFASLVAVRARGRAVLHATPETSGTVVVKLRDEEQLSVVSCRGDWLRVRYKTQTGWIAKNERCGNPVTTCV